MSQLNFLSYSLCLVLISLLLPACSNDSQVLVPTDYREQWEGTYEGTKSNTSLEDQIMTTPISFEVTINESSLNELNINGTNVPITDDGTFGPDFVNDSEFNYEVHFMDDGSVTLIIGQIFPEGISLPCYINAVRI